MTMPCTYDNRIQFLPTKSHVVVIYFSYETCKRYKYHKEGPSETCKLFVDK